MTRKKLSFHLAVCAAIILAASTSASAQAGPAAPEQTAPPAAAAPGTAASGEEHEQLMKALLLRLDAMDEKTRLEAGVALRELAQKSDVGLLAETLKKGNNVDKQVFIIETLGTLRGREALEALRFEMQNGQPAAQRAAVEAFGWIGDDWAIPILLRAIGAPDNDMQKRAASALGRIKSQQSLYALKNVSKIKDTPAGRARIWALDKAAGKYPDDQIDTELPPGRRADLNYKGTLYAFYQPSYHRRSDLKSRLLVCIHDDDLDLESMVQPCLGMAKKNQVAMIAPFFDDMRYPSYADFNIRSERADRRLLEIIEHVTKHAEVAAREVYLVGLKKGAVFIQRFALAYPDRVGRAAVMGSEFTMPDLNELFPKGVKPSPLAPDIKPNLLAFTKSDIALMFDDNPNTAKDSQQLYEAMEEVALREGVTSRLILRASLAPAKSVMFDEMERYLFTKR